ncbi:MAG: hypothetical protein ACRER2_05320 [Methylococcales bacterium]
MTRTNKKRLVGLVLLSVAAFFFSGCSVRVADLTLVSTKNIDLSDTQLDARKGQRQKAEDCSFVLLGLIPFGLPNMEEAVDKALEAGKGNVMVDEVTEYKNIYFIIGGLSCIVVEGTVLNAPETAGKPTVSR